ncbi:PF01594 domain protein [Bacteriovorax sp. BAL6_X]|uniref:AI-2E family transporter n=1 Tax=Bacteriovorax sp. BAL6_X TaxID=1201290 RepID=UPI000385684F|nr:AI-2E family transporter [Bacteriovorax sp. BAL6_X]EPZ49208.1 PF01594 domain protein [Bacteriovorax sp. BAL6_X]
MQNKFNVTYVFFGCIFLLVCYLVWMMAKQMIAPIIFGFVLAGVFNPLNNRFIEKYKLSDNLAATVTSCLIILLVLIPLIFLSIALSKEALSLYQTIMKAMSHHEVNDFLFGDGPVAVLIKSVSDITGVDIDMEQVKTTVFGTLKGISGTVISSINSIVGNIITFIFDLAIMMIVVFGIFVEGKRLKTYIFDLSPLPSDQEQKILDKFNQMNYVTLVCNGVGGVIQGVLGGLALWAAGIESVVLWTVLMIFLAFVPLVGISIVTIPASLYLVLTGSPASGVALFIFTALVGLIVENWFKPKFIGNRIQINSTFVLLAIIGGMGVFGMGGIFYGPIIGILFLTIVEIYHDQYNVVS